MSIDILTGPFRCVAVLNRGESATRFIRGAETWSRKNRFPLETIALYTEADAEAPFVKAATRAVRLDTDATDRKTPYLDLDLLLDTAQKAGADAVWPGWGFLSEEPALARACAARGLVFLGPSEQAIEEMSDKVKAKTLAEKVGVPICPWSKKPVGDSQRAVELLEEIGYPALLKSASGGGGRGIRRVDAPEDVPGAFQAAAAEALATSGNPELFIEHFVQEARHIEVQILADAHGNVWTLGTRDCSVQRRNQKLLEEAPAPNLLPRTDQAIQDAAQKLARACNYVGVGTAEFLLLPDHQTFFFLEMNTRLQVEHTVTEAIYGIDLVALQIDVARGISLASLPSPEPRGVALEARLNAEDPDDHFAPRTGRLIRFSPPDGPWVRVDTGYAEGNVVPSEFDSNIAKIITWGVNREDAVARMHTALLDTTCAIETGLSNRSLLLEIIADTPFRQGPVHTRWLESYLPERKEVRTRPYLAIALAGAALGDHLNARRQEMRLFFGEAITGLPRRIKEPGPRELKYLVGGVPVDVEISTLEPMHYLVRSGQWEALIRARSHGSSTMLLDFDGKRHSVIRVQSSDQVHVDVEGVAHRFERVSDGKVIAQIPAAVNVIHVTKGESIQAGQRLVTLEAMKMEFPVNAPIGGTIEEILVTPSQSVDAGTLLLKISIDTAGADQTGEPQRLAIPARRREELSVAEVLRARLLGYDIERSLEKRAFDALLDSPDSIEVEDLLELWSIYLSRECLFWKGPGDDAINEARESSSEQMAWFLRRRRLDDSVLSEPFCRRLTHHLGLHQVKEFELDDRLDNALVRLFQSRHDRRGADAIATEAIRAILKRTRTLPTDARAALLAAPFAWAGDDPLQILEAFATRASTRRRWELAALTWRYIHAVTLITPGLAGASEPLDAIPGERTFQGFESKPLKVDLITAPGILLEARELTPQAILEASLTKKNSDRRLLIEVTTQATRPAMERAFLDAATVIRNHSKTHAWNRIVIHPAGFLHLDKEGWMELARRFATQTRDLDLEALVIRPTEGILWKEKTLKTAVFHTATGLGPAVRLLEEDLPLSALTDHQRGMLSAHRRGLFYPFEVIDWLTGGPGSENRTVARVSFPRAPRGSFQEWDFTHEGQFTPAERPWGQNQANLVVGIIENAHPDFPDGLRRVLLVGDATRTMGSLGEEECRRVIAAIDLAEKEGIPLEWIPVSSGARIAFDSGTENLDWTAKALRRIIEFTQAGGIINIIVDGPCVGAQSYWNAEATMLMHCKGTLIMTERGFMILTGRKALEYSGSVSAETNAALGGEEIMLPNGEAQYQALDLIDAYQLLFRHYQFTYPAPSVATARDEADRDITTYPVDPAQGASTLGEFFDPATNPGRKRPFAIRDVITAVLDQDVPPLERWAPMEGAESAVTCLGKLGGRPVTIIGIESKPVPRKGTRPVDGPDTWMSGTLFPESSRKIARAINAASGLHPLVVLANLSGFDGSPESLRRRQLEFGAEIARAVVNFEGPILFNVIARYHGGAFVVFSRALNEKMNVSALEGTYASVIGGAPAAAVVFPREVDRRLKADPRYAEISALTEGADKRVAIASLRAELQSALATEFDTVHNIERARSVGSLDEIVAPGELRSFLIGNL